MIYMVRIMITRKGISNRIKQKFGLNAEVSISDGCAHFFSETNINLMNHLLSTDDSCVMVCRLNHLSYDQWLDEFECALKGFNND